MRTGLLSLLLVFFLIDSSTAQNEPDSIFNAIFDSTEDLTPHGRRPLFRDTTKNWTFGGNLSLVLSQSTFVNWAAGGENSFALNSNGEFYSLYERRKMVWLNDLRLAYGIHKVGGRRFRKDNDELIFLSKAAWNTRYYKIFTTTLAELRTQIFPGYNLPNDTTLVSGFFSPAYLMTGAGIDYVPFKVLRITVAPLAAKLTFVLNNNVASQNIYFSSHNVGTQNVRYESGAYVTIRAEGDLSEIVEYESQLSLFSNYFVKPQNIDVDWLGRLDVKIAKVFTISIITRLVYDDDVDTGIDKDNDGQYESRGPRVQFKEIVGAGLLIDL